ncbi:MAG TPA: EscU/YscU/HrcU family type III secretion system export apparatus switch protein [Mobilitalea sp.]|nr:EscU/YscU/HrcU family type III secretion system export apparatus switch protein [Mobilitalea sp.]
MKQQDQTNTNQEDKLADINNRNRTAVAISYDPKENAPKVIASGKGYLADKIIAKAKEEDIPLHKDEKLAGTLSKLEIGNMIPPELYEVIAEILVFVDKMDRIKGKVL